MRIINKILIYVYIQSELCGSGRSLGCRSMSQRLRSRHGMSVGRNMVLHQMRLLDPEGVEARRRHRLIRRKYRNKGPNSLAHMDGYDKIKRYGLAIHGATDGNSRRVLWLKVNRTNNDPKVVASYFLEVVTEAKGAQRCIRMDAGSENGVVANMQKSFRWFHGDEMAGAKSVLIGSSPSNQRIECWWRRLHAMCIAAWQDILGDLESRGIFSAANNLHIECVRFCFTQIIQHELDLCRQEWNDHQIRRQNGDEVHGKPEIL
ncbi:uncharacterized protein LOC123560686 [Mercenaria mercenaria]|uniref:uncharacterized protein LOC123560686 n=1 Tax=Mercenaria mercenaria TaxID=6596 RepID=UPI00234EE31B|nr:uncharacterized protein LOC123560686 [Mercenaria mercenaria]